MANVKLWNKIIRPPVATASALTSVDTSTYDNGILCVITGLTKLYELSKTDTQTPNATSVIAATPTGNWLAKVSRVFSVASQVDMLALPANEGDLANRTDINQTFVHNSGITGSISDWTAISDASPSLIPLEIVSFSSSSFNVTGANLGQVIECTNVVQNNFPIFSLAQFGTSGITSGFYVYLKNSSQFFAQIIPTTTLIDGQTVRYLAPGQTMLVAADSAQYVGIASYESFQMTSVVGDSDYVATGTDYGKIITMAPSVPRDLDFPGTSAEHLPEGYYFDACNIGSANITPILNILDSSLNFPAVIEPGQTCRFMKYIAGTNNTWLAYFVETGGGSSPTNVTVVSSSTYTLPAGEDGNILLFTNPGNVLVTLPQTSTTAIPLGYGVTAVANVGFGNTVKFVIEGSDVLSGYSQLSNGQSAQISKTVNGTPNTWQVGETVINGAVALPNSASITLSHPLNAIYVYSGTVDSVINFPSLTASNSIPMGSQLVIANASANSFFDLKSSSGSTMRAGIPPGMTVIVQPNDASGGVNITLTTDMKREYVQAHNGSGAIIAYGKVCKAAGFFSSNNTPDVISLSSPGVDAPVGIVVQGAWATGSSTVGLMKRGVGSFDLGVPLLNAGSQIYVNGSGNLTSTPTNQIGGIILSTVAGTIYECYIDFDLSIGSLQKSDNLAALASASTARTNLGLGTMATQDANNISPTGGVMTGVTISQDPFIVTTISASSHTAAVVDGSTMVVMTNASGGTFQVPATSITALPLGYWVYVANQTAVGKEVIVEAQGIDGFSGNGHLEYGEIGIAIKVVNGSPNKWIFSKSFASGAVSLPNTSTTTLLNPLNAVYYFEGNVDTLVTLPPFSGLNALALGLPVVFTNSSFSSFLSLKNSAGVFIAQDLPPGATLTLRCTAAPGDFSTTFSLDNKREFVQAVNNSGGILTLGTVCTTNGYDFPDDILNATTLTIPGKSQAAGIIIQNSWSPNDKTYSLMKKGAWFFDLLLFALPDNTALYVDTSGQLTINTTSQIAGVILSNLSGSVYECYIDFNLTVSNPNIVINSDGVIDSASLNSTIIGGRHVHTINAAQDAGIFGAGRVQIDHNANVVVSASSGSTLFKTTAPGQLTLLADNGIISQVSATPPTSLFDNSYTVGISPTHPYFQISYNTGGDVNIVNLSDFININIQTGTSYTLINPDINSLLIMNNSSVKAVTIPNNVLLDSPVGTRFKVFNNNASGNLIFVLSAGDTSIGSLTLLPGNSAILTKLSITGSSSQWWIEQEAGNTPPSFSVALGTTDSNVTGDGTTYILGSGNILTKIIDPGNNVSVTGVFIAPQTRTYWLYGAMTLNGQALATDALLQIQTTAKTYNVARFLSGAITNAIYQGGAFVPMTAGNTATLRLTVSGLAKIVSVVGNGTAGVSYFGGFGVA